MSVSSISSPPPSSTQRFFSTSLPSFHLSLFSLIYSVFFQDPSRSSLNAFLSFSTFIHFYSFLPSLLHLLSLPVYIHLSIPSSDLSTLNPSSYPPFLHPHLSLLTIFSFFPQPEFKEQTKRAVQSSAPPPPPPSSLLPERGEW